MVEASNRRTHILAVASDAASDFAYYERKEDETLPRGEIEAAIEAGEITIDEIVSEFSRELRRALR